MMAIYFRFVLLVAFAKPLLGALVLPGLSLGILLGALVIVAAWGLIWVYVRWANAHYDRGGRDVLTSCPGLRGAPVRRLYPGASRTRIARV